MLLAATPYAGDERATEVFARQFDWVIATALARQGRMNGQLSSVQHDWLPGHGGARPPVANARSANALAGYVAKAGRLGEGAQRSVEAAVLAAQVPASVHEVRQQRSGQAPLAGPRVVTEDRTVMAKRELRQSSQLLWSY
jgi:hypothetical protein